MTTITEDKIIWGASEIGKTINRSEKATFVMLEAGKVPGARKVGGRWALKPSVFFASFESVAA